METPSVSLRQLFRTYLGEDDSLDGIELTSPKSGAVVAARQGPEDVDVGDVKLSDADAKLVSVFFWFDYSVHGCFDTELMTLYLRALIACH